MPKIKIQRKVLAWIVFFILLCSLFAIIFSVEFYRIKGDIQEDPHVTGTIRDLGSRALENLDVPVGAVLLYQGEIIGEGYNRVIKDTNLAAHAEIMAMNNAVKTLGRQQFDRLDRSKLIMVSSYEPCEMCRGAMMHYGITKVVFYKDKPFSMWLKSYRRFLLYEMNKRQAKGEEMQDSLFQLHPDYPGK